MASWVCQLTVVLDIHHETALALTHTKLCISDISGVLCLPTHCCAKYPSSDHETALTCTKFCKRPDKNLRDIHHETALTHTKCCKRPDKNLSHRMKWRQDLVLYCCVASDAFVMFLPLQLPVFSGVCISSSSTVLLLLPRKALTCTVRQPSRVTETLRYSSVYASGTFGYSYLHSWNTLIPLSLLSWKSLIQFSLRIWNTLIQFSLRSWMTFSLGCFCWTVQPVLNCTAMHPKWMDYSKLALALIPFSSMSPQFVELSCWWHHHWRLWKHWLPLSTVFDLYNWVWHKNVLI